jgi:hypothetical protein
MDAEELRRKSRERRAARPKRTASLDFAGAPAAAPPPRSRRAGPAVDYAELAGEKDGGEGEAGEEAARFE